jgi:hypothetical protein
VAETLIQSYKGSIIENKERIKEMLGRLSYIESKMIVAWAYVDYVGGAYLLKFSKGFSECTSLGQGRSRLKLSNNRIGVSVLVTPCARTDNALVNTNDLTIAPFVTNIQYTSSFGNPASADFGSADAAAYFTEFDVHTHNQTTASINSAYYVTVIGIENTTPQAIEV